jgi:2-methylcitrate dehydratase PrpD
MKKTPVKAGDIEHVVVKSFPEAIAYPGCDHTGPYRTLLQAKMSIQFVVAAALVHGRVDDAVLRDFSSDSEAARLARRVRLEDDAGFAGGFPQRQGAEVVVTTKSGRSASLRLAELEPLDAAGVRSRMRASLARLLGEARAQSIAREIDAIVGCQDASRIVRLLAQ